MLSRKKTKKFKGVLGIRNGQYEKLLEEDDIRAHAGDNFVRYLATALTCLGYTFGGAIATENQTNKPNTLPRFKKERRILLLNHPRFLDNILDQEGLWPTNMRVVRVANSHFGIDEETGEHFTTLENPETQRYQSLAREIKTKCPDLKLVNGEPIDYAVVKGQIPIVDESFFIELGEPPIRTPRFWDRFMKKEYGNLFKK